MNNAYKENKCLALPLQCPNVLADLGVTNRCDKGTWATHILHHRLRATQRHATELHSIHMYLWSVQAHVVGGTGQSSSVEAGVLPRL